MSGAGVGQSSCLVMVLGRLLLAGEAKVGEGLYVLDAFSTLVEVAKCLTHPAGGPRLNQLYGGLLPVSLRWLALALLWPHALCISFFVALRLPCAGGASSLEPLHI